MRFKFAELTDGSIQRRPPGRLKWGDIELKRGGSSADELALRTAPAGSTFTLQAPAGRDPAALADLRAAAVAQERFALLVTRTTGAVPQKIVEEHVGMTIARFTVQRLAAMGSGFGIEIELRKG